MAFIWRPFNLMVDVVLRSVAQLDGSWRVPTVGEKVAPGSGEGDSRRKTPLFDQWWSRADTPKPRDRARRGPSSSCGRSLAAEGRPQPGFRVPHAIGRMHGAAEKPGRNRRPRTGDRSGREESRRQAPAGRGKEHGRNGHRSRLQLRRASAASTLLAASAIPARRRAGGLMAAAGRTLAAHRAGPFSLRAATHRTDTLTGSLDSKDKAGGQPQHGHARAQQAPTAPAAGTTAFHVRAGIQSVGRMERRTELRFL
jgi:hypothetical protein